MKNWIWVLVVTCVLVVVILALRSGTDDPWSGWAGGMVGAFIGVWAALTLAHLQERDTRATQRQEQINQARQARRTDFAQRALELDQATHRLKWVFSDLRQTELFSAFIDPANAREAVWVFDREYRLAFQRAESAVDALGQLNALPLDDDHTPEGRFGQDLARSDFYEAGEFLDTLSKNYASTLDALFQATAKAHSGQPPSLEDTAGIFQPVTISLYYDTLSLKGRVMQLLKEPI